LFSHTLPVDRAKKDIIRVEHCHLALQHYSGGRPVPRAASLYDGGIQKYANIFAYVQVFSAHFAFLYPFQTIKSQGLQAILILSGSD
jgi:hypothetical protein